ncbi:MAG: hypothetical protein MUC35_00070 [Candidatus Margulisbacteria bacterium]|jgi:flagellar biogenesis protein FliO|nr:hypothetical protein [Candidatus Margulisiibacteriota bacterium]
MITASYIIQVILSLLVVIALIVVIGRFLLPKLAVTAGSRLIQIVDRAYLEPQVSAYVLKVKDKAWLVVTSSKTVAKIGEVEV